METTSSVEIERLERKVDMSLDDIIKMQKKLQRKARKGSRRPKRKNAIQESVASCTAAVKQGRVIKSRRGNRDSTSLVPRNIAQKVSYRIGSAKMKKRNRKRSSKSTCPTGDLTSNIKVLVAHDLRRRLLSGTRKSGLAARITPRPEKMESGGSQRHLQTLDSRFASLSRSRQASSGSMHRPGRDGF